MGETAAYCHFGREAHTKDGIKFFEWENAKDLARYAAMTSEQVAAALKGSGYLTKWVDWGRLRGGGCVKSFGRWLRIGIATTSPSVLEPQALSAGICDGSLRCPARLEERVSARQQITCH